MRVLVWRPAPGCCYYKSSECVDQLGLGTVPFANTAVMSGLQSLRALTLILVAVAVAVDAASNIPSPSK